MAAAAEAGAIRASYILMRLPFEVAPPFRAWLAAHYPDRADKVMHMAQDIRGGRDKAPHFFTRMHGHRAWAQPIPTPVTGAACQPALEQTFPPIRIVLLRTRARAGTIGSISPFRPLLGTL